MEQLEVTTGLSAPFNNLAVIYKQQGSYADAITCYSEVLRIDPLAADGLVNRGNTYKEIGRVNEAIQDYLRAIAVRPTMAEAHANLASAYKDRDSFALKAQKLQLRATDRPWLFDQTFLKQPVIFYTHCSVSVDFYYMATCVAGSLCLATGVGEEMIVNSMTEYEEKAVSLALDRPKLQSLTDKLKAVRSTCPLFDTERWVKNLERSYFKMWNIHCSGQQPDHFKVKENDKEFPYDR
ncbi:hypothetical protein ACFE04_022239 [Oxalis oulophora]